MIIFSSQTVPTKKEWIDVDRILQNLRQKRVQTQHHLDIHIHVCSNHTNISDTSTSSAYQHFNACHTQLDISADLPRCGLDAALHKLCQPCHWEFTEFTAQIGWFPSFRIHQRSIYQLEITMFFNNKAQQRPTVKNPRKLNNTQPMMFTHPETASMIMSNEKHNEYLHHFETD